MAVRPGRYLLGPGNGRLRWRTFRNGLAATAGHDLTIEVSRWSGGLTVSDELTPAGLSLRIEPGSMTVLTGSGGVKPLTDRDRREIAVTARQVLAADRYPEATFTAGDFKPDSSDWLIGGTLTVKGQPRRCELRASETGPGRYRLTGSVLQSEFGIKPYRAFLGALRVRDAVDIEAEAALTEPAPAGGPS
ncbi:MAG: YceI family protein [Actinobacteria bacterium]|nr:YceI family protein [Actinomycetota bacterium]